MSAVFTVADLVALLRLERVSEWRFHGRSPSGGTAHIFGGQIVAQAIMAMGQTVAAERALHSAQGYFLRAGERDRPLVFEVESLREGRGFSTRSVRVIQGDKLLYFGSASFQAAEGDDERLEPMAAVLEPEAFEAEADYLAECSQPTDAKPRFSPFFIDLFERRSAQWRAPVNPGVLAPRNSLWIRLRERIDDDALLHQALVAYISDMDLMTTAMRPRGIGQLDPSALAVSLDHVMWFHAPVRADEWFYYDIEGPCAIRNRGLGAGAIYQNGGRRITAMQEGLLRVQP
ncbi:acyl-CoA thioesterase [Hydrocarboniphaga effusa]|uniref:acyl-CoA thioesterase n=1 Tax=Hydrocarboniphaga effusa TaxID=243629 RepID=UPI003BAA3455